jgi:hypothetical protein
MGTTYTNEGEALVADLIDVASTATVTGWYISWGSGTVTDAKTSTGLEAEATEIRVTATTEDQPAADTNRWIGTHTCGAVAKTVSETGLHTAATNGDMPIFGTYTGIALATDDQVQYTITLQQT